MKKLTECSMEEATVFKLGSIILEYARFSGTDGDYHIKHSDGEIYFASESVAKEFGITFWKYPPSMVYECESQMRVDKVNGEMMKFLVVPLPKDWQGTMCKVTVEGNE